MEKLLSISAKRSAWLIVLLAAALTAKAQKMSLVSMEAERIEITSAYDVNQDKKAIKVLKPYKLRIDSIMCPVIGVSDCVMTAKAPESLLSNWVADVLLKKSLQYAGYEVDMSVINIGGLRSAMPLGKVTRGDIYDIAPFENTLCIVKLTGRDLHTLLDQIAGLGGTGVSGVRMQISKDRKLLSATIGGKAVEPDSIYSIATVDYLAEGNDGMMAFTLAKEKTMPKGATLRQLLLDYVAEQNRAGKHLTSALDGRIEIK